MTSPENNQFELRDIELSSLDVWSGVNVRTDDITADIDGLAKSLDTIGLQQPIVVQEDGQRYKILIGQRRFLAAKRLGWRRITARVVNNIDEPSAIMWSISENIHRRDLSPRDKSNACQYLLEKHGSTTAVATLIGFSEQTVKKWLGYYHVVPEPMKKMVEDNKITASLAIRIAEAVDDPQKATAIAEQIPAGRARGLKAERDRLLTAMEEDPDRPVALIKQRADELRTQKRVTFILPPQWKFPLESAARELRKEEGDVARDALVQWLEVSRYHPED